MPLLKIKIRRAEEIGHSVRREVEKLCLSVFLDPFNILHGSTPSDALHVLGRGPRGKLLTHALITRHELRIGKSETMTCAYISHVATKPDCQGRGYGRQIMAAALEEAARKGNNFSLAVLVTSCPAWYARNGWEPWTGTIFQETSGGLSILENDSETFMVYRLNNSPSFVTSDTLVTCGQCNKPSAK